MIRHRDTKCFNDVGLHISGSARVVWQSPAFSENDFHRILVVVAVVRHCLLINVMTLGGSGVDSWCGDKYRRRLCLAGYWPLYCR